MKNHHHNTYELIDSGNGRKLERFGAYLIARPCSQAVWQPLLPQENWEQADADFSREQTSRWLKKPLPEFWTIEVSGITFKLSPTDFGHLGIFSEQQEFWSWIQDTVTEARKIRSTPINVLNLFAYSGGSTLAAAKAGAHLCHLDASKGMVAWAKENALANNLESAPIRWIIDDVSKFLKREQRRGQRYDAIILDPPSFGRGSRGEVFKIEEDIEQILNDCRSLLSDNPLFVLFSCHTPGFTPVAMHHLMHQMMHQYSGSIDTGEMLLRGSQATLPVPCGTFARWTHVNAS